MVLTVYTNQDNPATLKILIAHNLSKSKENIEVEFCNPHDKVIPEPKHLPCLLVNSELTFFSSNAAICYLFPPLEDISSKVYDWLEWEANKLSPALVQLGGSVKNESIKNNVLNLLKLIDKQIENNYIAGDVLTAADISIWSLLVPLYQYQKEFLYDVPNIVKWFETLQNFQSFKFSLYAYMMKEEVTTVYNALGAGAKYLTSSSSNVQGIEKVPDKKEKDSPQHTVESVSDEEILAAQKAWERSLTQLSKLKENKKEVLPVPGEKNILITSALPYVNNVPHLGNIIGCVLSADVFARFCRLCNYNTLYICGTDEYGTATETKALEEGLSCQEICDKYFKIHSEIYKWFNISFDHFGRTSNKEQTELCQDIFLQLNDNGFTFTQSVDQLHCEKCDRYLADRFVEGGCPNIGCNYEDARGDQCDGCGKLVNAVELKSPRCKICRNTPKLKTSTQFFIDLPKLEPLLHHWVKISSPGWTNNAQVIARSWLKEGLKPRCITRDLKWGVPVPLNGYQNKVFYVWFDAPIGYMSISKAYTKNFQKWWQATKDTEVSLYQFMAKDNVPFHAVLFPSMLLGCNRGYTTVSHIMATEYLNYEDGKFSKSRGVGVFGNDAQSTGIPSDVWRFYLLYVRPESQDSSFCWSDLVTKNNSELLNNLGNFINRALVFAKNNFNNIVPEIRPNREDYTLLALSTREYKGYVSSLEKGRLRDGIRHILAISRHGNQYMQSNQPWVLLKSTDEEKLRAGTVVGICCNLACLLATLLQPYMPDTSANLKKQLNTKDVGIVLENIEIVNLLPTGHKLGDPSPLFAKIDIAKIEELKQKFAGTQNERKNNQNSNNVIGDIKTIEEEVSKQADKVRKLKSSAAEKSVWQPEVAILLNLKKKLELAQKCLSQPTQVQAPSQNNIVSAAEVKRLEEAVSKQGDKVRQLKSSGVEKSVWQPEVAILLDLKNKLQLAQKSSSQPPQAQTTLQTTIVNATEVKRLEEEVSKQGTLVRKLKEGGADKSKWQPEVNKLLALKNQLAAATGVPVPAPQSKSKKK